MRRVIYNFSPESRIRGRVNWIVWLSICCLFCRDLHKFYQHVYLYVYLCGIRNNKKVEQIIYTYR